MTNNKQPPEQERRRFSRVVHSARTELHQGGTTWDVTLMDISLNGFAVTRPEKWDADYSHPFGVIIYLEDGSRFVAFAHLVRVESDILGFHMEHLDAEKLPPLARLLSEKLEDEVLQEELGRLETDDP